jgi:hypothetical protein
MATYAKSIYGVMGQAGRTFDKSVSAASSFSGGAADSAVLSRTIAAAAAFTGGASGDAIQFHEKTITAAMGIVASGADTAKSIVAASGRSGGMSRAGAVWTRTFGATIDAPAPPFVWMEPYPLPPRITMSGLMVRAAGSGSFDKAAGAVSGRAGGMVVEREQHIFVKRIGGDIDAGIGMAGSMRSGSAVDVPDDRRRSLRWVAGKRGRRDSW